MLRGVKQPEEFLGMENRSSDRDREQTQTQLQNHSQSQPQQTGFGRAGVAAAYARSFATLCAGPTETLLDDLGPGSGGKLLDAGCGVGGFSRAAAGRGWAVTAVDSSAEMIAATRAAVRGLPVEVRSGSVLDLPSQISISTQRWPISSSIMCRIRGSAFGRWRACFVRAEKWG